MKRAQAGEIPPEIPVSDIVGSIETRRSCNLGDRRALRLPEGRPITEEDFEEVEGKLKTLCYSIMNECNSRMKKSLLMEATFDALFFI